LLGTLHSRLRGGKCRPYNSDTKIRIQLPTHVRFYYPDASVICRPNPAADSFQDQPALVAEVVSLRTRRIDAGEKKDAYLSIPTLSLYMLVEQELPEVTVYRRTDDGFVCETYRGPESVIPLSEIAADLPLRELFDGVEFEPEQEDTDD
jgi:Uma2 family endonuclease